MGTNINQLSTIDEVRIGDKIPVYSSENGDTRKASINVLMEYIRENLGDAVADTLSASEYVSITGVFVSELPSPTSLLGARGTVTDSSQDLTAGIGAVVAGGGANVVPVFSDGANWLIG